MENMVCVIAYQHGFCFSSCDYAADSFLALSACQWGQESKYNVG